MTVGNPKEVPEYELNPLELQVRKVDGISKVCTRADIYFSDPKSLLYSDVFVFASFAGNLSSC